MTEKTTMNLKEQAKAYVPPQTKNIADLERVDIEQVELQDGSGQNRDGEKFTYKYIEVNEEEYRVPGVVIKQIKTLVEDDPNVKAVKVLRSGEGKSTQYIVRVVDTAPTMTEEKVMQ
jgi:hypothetical protein